jgi:HAE1 family hydrophobic/amphiphilic exporter-1
VQERLVQYDEVKHILTTIGSITQMEQGTNVALAKIKLVETNLRDMSTNEMATMFIKELSDIPNATFRVSAISMIGGQNDPISFNLLGQNVDTLEVYKNKIINRIKSIEGLINLNSSSRAGKPEITLTPDRAKLATAGVTVFDLAMTLRSAMTGVISTQYRDQGEEYDIRVTMNERSFDSPEEVGTITVVSQHGQYRLSQLADIKFTEGYSTILHKDKYKTIEFTGAVAPGYVLGGITGEITRRTADIQFPSGYSISWGGAAEMMQETAIDMLRTFVIALILTYMLLAAILESLTQPLMILGTVPLAFIGVFLGLFLTGLSMNSISMMAIVMLLGIVVNNAILLLDYTNLLVRKEGKDVRTALLEACPTKLKPILMASLAIILGMLPMAMGLGAAGREMRQPMGVVAIGGLIVSTVLALIVIPVLYNLASRKKKTATEQA